MSFVDKVNLMKSALNALTDSIKNKAAAVRNSSTQSDNANKLQGFTLTALNTELDTVLTTHRNNKNNPHQETAASVGIPVKATVDAALNRLLPTGVIPISRYGSFTYLPVGVSGSFESGTLNWNSGFRRIPLLMEADGTLVGIRNATDGATRGAFYFYLENARTNSLSNQVMSNRRYRPSFIPSNMYVSRVYYSGEGVLTGEVTKYDDSSHRQLFVSLTGGTLDDSLHTGALVPIEVINPAADGKVTSWEPVLLGDIIYLIINAAGMESNSSPNYRVFTMSVSQLLGGTLSTVQEITGWLVTGVNGVPTQKTNISLAASLSTPSLTGDAIFRYDPTDKDSIAFGVFSDGGITKCLLDKDTGKIRVWTWSSVRMRMISKLSTSTREYVYSLVIDPVNKTAVLDDPYLGGTEIYHNENATLLSSNINYFKSLGTVLGSTAYASKTIEVTKDGYVFGAIITISAAGTNTLNRIRISNWSGYENAIPANMVPTNSVSAPMYSISPTVIGSGYRNVNIYKKGHLRLVSRGLGAWESVIAKYKEDGEQPTYAYKSVGGPDIPGYAPNLFRQLATSTAQTSLVEFDQNDIITNIRVGTLYRGKYSTLDSFSDEGSLTGGTFSVTPSVLDALVLEAYNSLGSTDTLLDVFGQLYVPKDPAAPVFLVGASLEAGGIQRVFCFNCIPNVRTGNITSIALGNLVDSRSISFRINANKIGTWGAGDCFSAQFRKYPEGWGVILQCVALNHTSGNAISVHYKFFYSNGGAVEGLHYQQIVPSTPLDIHYFLEDHGYGKLCFNATDTDHNTNLNFITLGKTKSNFVSPPPSTRENMIVVLSQQVPTGWIVYFTDDTPLFMAGNSYVIPQASVNLEDITPNPADKKFFVYARLVSGVPQYEVRETEISESETVMYVGHIRTNSMSITEIVIDKVDRVGTYRISTRGVGSAIPVSAGSPMNPEKLVWS